MLDTQLLLKVCAFVIFTDLAKLLLQMSESQCSEQQVMEYFLPHTLTSFLVIIKLVSLIENRIISIKQYVCDSNLLVSSTSCAIRKIESLTSDGNEHSIICFSNISQIVIPVWHFNCDL